MILRFLGCSDSHFQFTLTSYFWISRFSLPFWNLQTLQFLFGCELNKSERDSKRNNVCLYPTFFVSAQTEFWSAFSTCFHRCLDFSRCFYTLKFTIHFDSFQNAKKSLKTDWRSKQKKLGTCQGISHTHLPAIFSKSSEKKTGASANRPYNVSNDLLKKVNHLRRPNTASVRHPNFNRTSWSNTLEVRALLPRKKVAAREIHVANRRTDHERNCLQKESTTRIFQESQIPMIFSWSLQNP